MNIVYVASLLHYNGIEHVGRSLTRHLSTEHDVQVCGAIVRQDSELLQGRVRDWVMSAETLDEVDVVYIEGGWNDDDGGATEKFSLELAESFVLRGGQLFVADVDRNAAQAQRQSLAAAARLFGTSISYGKTRRGNEGVSYLLDEGAEERYGIRFFSDQMLYVSERLKPALAGIDSILAAAPVKLVGGDIAACGNVPTTGVLVLDEFVDGGGIAPWATVHEFGRGHAVLIGAWVSHDLNIEDCPDNARWISNLISLVTDRSRETAGWLVRKSARSQASTDLRDLLNQQESQQLERKSSFLVSTDPKRSDVPQYVIQHAVGKSIVALANTDGGYVIIGQDDQGEVLALEKDFAAVRNNDRDGFEQKLVQYADNHMNPRWETLGLKVHWVDTEAGDVAIVEVPESHEVVWFKQKGGPEGVYVRRGTRTDALAGPNLANWLKARQQRQMKKHM